MKFLREIFDQPYSFDRSKRDEHLHSYKFNSPSSSYEAFFYHPDHDKTHAAVTFGAGKQNKVGKTGAEKENSHKVFSTVHHIIKQHLADHPNIKSVEFSGTKDYDNDTEGNRVKLYRHMVKQFTHSHTERHTQHNVHFHIKKEHIK